jgi:hydroxymethylpyrimidine/phosphomethylpyrimidine kinase
MSTPIALTIAGSDSGGGAGIQADLKTFHALGVFGTCAVTAITAQNTLGVTGIHAVPPGMVRQQIDAVVSDLRPAASKTGMLATAELVQTVAAAIRDHKLHNYVLDPVIVATSGDRLLDEDAVASVREHLLPLAALVTPNLPEAAVLVGFEVDREDAMHEAARWLVANGARAALVKGGHLSGPQVVDVFYDGERVHRWARDRIDTRNTHGTGCTLSAAIAAGLAYGRSSLQSVENALDFVRRALLAAPGLGAGHGPLNHMI